MKGQHLHEKGFSITNHQGNTKSQWDIITPHLLEWLPWKRQVISSVGEEVEQREPLGTVDTNVNSAATMENSREIPQKLKNRTTIWPSNPTFGYISKEDEIIISKRYLHLHVHWALFTIAKKWKDPKYLSNDAQIKIMWWVCAYIWVHVYVHTHTLSQIPWSLPQKGNAWLGIKVERNLPPHSS